MSIGIPGPIELGSWELDGSVLKPQPEESRKMSTCHANLELLSKWSAKYCIAWKKERGEAQRAALARYGTPA